jgi:hypothetical protein
MLGCCVAAHSQRRVTQSVSFVVAGAATLADTNTLLTAMRFPPDFVALGQYVQDKNKFGILTVKLLKFFEQLIKPLQASCEKVASCHFKLWLENKTHTKLAAFRGAGVARAYPSP